MEKQFQNGMWPVMLTPLQQNGDVDYPALEELINWYIKEGSAGLFAVCQSSEMFYLSKEEREELTRFIKKNIKWKSSCYFIRSYFIFPA